MTQTATRCMEEVEEVPYLFFFDILSHLSNFKVTWAEKSMLWIGFELNY